jgi:hypothetical protein
MSENSLDIISAILGLVATSLQVVFMVAPATSLLQGLKTRQVKDISIIYLIAQAVISSFWMIYGMKLKYNNMILPNVICLALDFIFISMYFYILDQFKEIIVSLSSIVILNIVLYLFVKIQLLDLLCLVLTTVYIATMYITIRETLATKDPSYTNLTLCISAICYASLWMIYGVINNVLSLWLVNLFMVLTGSINLYIYFWTKGYLKDNDFIIQVLKKILRIQTSTPEDEKLIQV